MISACYLLSRKLLFLVPVVINAGIEKKGKRFFGKPWLTPELLLIFRFTFWLWWFDIGNMEEFGPGLYCYAGGILRIHGETFYRACFHARIAYVAAKTVNLPGFLLWFHVYCLARAFLLADPARDAPANIDYHVSP